MALDTYANFQASIADQLARSDLTSQIIDSITLFESEASSELFRMRLAEKTAILVPSNPAPITIVTAINNGAGLIRVGVTAGAAATLTTGMEVIVTGVLGTTEANGSWIITVIGPNAVDLQGSTFTNAYVSGGALQPPQGTAALPSDYMGWRTVTWTGQPEYVLEYVTPETYLTEFPNSVTPGLTADNPRVFTIEGSTLKIMPVDTTPLEFDYYGKTSAISSALNWLFTNQIECYTAGVMEKLHFYYLKDFQKATVYKSQKQEAFDDIKKQNFREAGSLRIRPQGFAAGATP